MAFSAISLIVATGWVTALLVVCLLCRAAKAGDEALQETLSMTAADTFVPPPSLLQAANH